MLCFLLNHITYIMWCIYHTHQFHFYFIYLFYQWTHTTLLNKIFKLGDKEHHKPVYHLAMPLHFCVVYTVLLAPCTIHRYIQHVIKYYKNKDHNIRGNLNLTENNNKDDSKNNSKDNDIKYTNAAAVAMLKNKKIEVIKERKKLGKVSRGTLNGGETFESNNSIYNNCRIKKRKSNKLISYSNFIHMLLFLSVVFVLQHFSLSHPFLLSDNRCVALLSIIRNIESFLPCRYQNREVSKGGGRTVMIITFKWIVV